LHGISEYTISPEKPQYAYNKALVIKAAPPSSRHNMKEGFLPTFAETIMIRNCGSSAAPDMMLLMKTLPVKFPTL